jgi:hypothetical protein
MTNKANSALEDEQTGTATAHLLSTPYPSRSTTIYYTFREICLFERCLFVQPTDAGNEYNEPIVNIHVIANTHCQNE